MSPGNCTLEQWLNTQPPEFVMEYYGRLDELGMLPVGEVDENLKRYLESRRERKHPG